MRFNGDMSDELSNSIFKEVFDIEVERIIKGILAGDLAGNYTKGYETYRRVENIVIYFKEELAKKKGVIEIADIGCANGWFIFYLNQLFNLNDRAHFYGIDISSLDINIAKVLKKAFDMDNIIFDVGDAENLSLPDNFFDIVLCSEVIEHLTHPENSIKEIRRVLKPGGVAIITTPNKDNLVLKFGFLFRDKRIDSFADITNKLKHEPRHISVKGVSEWIKIVRAQGFEIERLRRGSPIAGGTKYNTHPILFSIVLVLDRVFDWLPFTLNFTENITFKLRKPKVLKTSYNEKR